MVTKHGPPVRSIEKAIPEEYIRSQLDEIKSSEENKTYLPSAKSRGEEGSRQKLRGGTLRMCDAQSLTKLLAREAAAFRMATSISGGEPSTEACIRCTGYFYDSIYKFGSFIHGIKQADISHSAFLHNYQELSKRIGVPSHIEASIFSAPKTSLFGLTHLNPQNAPLSLSRSFLITTPLPCSEPYSKLIIEISITSDYLAASATTMSAKVYSIRFGCV